MKTLEQITETLESLSDNDLFDLWNGYQAEISGEAQIYQFDDEFFETFFSPPQDAARAVYFGKIESWGAKYIMFNDYGNLEAHSYLENMISLYDLANHIEQNQDEFQNILTD